MPITLIEQCGCRCSAEWPGPAAQPVPERAPRRACDNRAAANPAGHVDQQRYGDVRAPWGADLDVPAADCHIVSVDRDAGLRDYGQASAAYLRVHIDRRVTDDRFGEIQLAGAAGHAHLDPPRHDPTADPAHVAAAALQPYHIFGSDWLADLERCDCLTASRQIAGQGRELAVRAGGERDLHALVKLFSRQPAVTGGHPQHLDHAVSVLVRRPQLVDPRSIVAAPSWRNVASHGHTLSPASRRKGGHVTDSRALRDRGHHQRLDRVQPVLGLVKYDGSCGFEYLVGHLKRG